MDKKKDCSRKIQRRQDSLNNYLDELVKKYSRLDVVRIDLLYKKEARSKVTIESFDKDLNRLNNNRRGNEIFDNVVGYVSKMEQGDKVNDHLHAHLVFFINGQKSKDRSGSSIARKIGNYWEQTITKGNGSHHNCNIKKYKSNGLGRVDYNDKTKIQIVKENTLSYLCKGEQSIITPEGKKIKALRRGGMPKQTNKGRPRKSKPC
ncbi:YagK/YfjJ domain-containing protein [Campylobacter sp. MOP51]|uniref:YagK/YfjJ domain-containing protein n=1 Tax=Campylobacter canis TaxID=3378588 RepID=UPI003C4BA64E